MIRLSVCAACNHTSPRTRWGHCPCGCRDHFSGPPHTASPKRFSSLRWGGPDALVTIAVIAGLVLAYLFVVLSW